MTKILIQTHLYQEPADGYTGSFFLYCPRESSKKVILAAIGMFPLGCKVGRSNLSKSGPYEPTFFSWMGVHALMAVRTLILSLVKYTCDAVDLCVTA